MSKADMMKVVDYFGSRGTKGVVLSGGEPSLIDDLPRLLERMKHWGMKTVMSTNGLTFNSLMPALAPWLDWVSLPLDASTPEVNRLMRVGDSSHFEKVFALIPEIRRSYPALKIKLGTVVSQINQHSVSGLPAILGPERRPDLWKLYQITYTNYGGDNRNALYLSDKDFEAVAAEAARQAAAHNIPFKPRWNNGRDGRHVFVDPNGDALVIHQDTEMIVGNAISAPHKLCQALVDHVKNQALAEHFENNYPTI